jgi:hypothetical protein
MKILINVTVTLAGGMVGRLRFVRLPLTTQVVTRLEPVLRRAVLRPTAGASGVEAVTSHFAPTNASTPDQIEDSGIIWVICKTVSFGFARHNGIE